MPDDILKYLESRKPEIEEAIRRILPESLDQGYVNWAFGKPRFEYDIDSLGKALSEPAWDLLNRGGKRWRPALFLLIGEMLGVEKKKLMEFAALPELVHSGSLITDDIEDLGDLRRGKPCTHKIFGQDVAINAGNFLYFVPALAMIKSRTLDDRTLNRVYESYIQEMINIHLGQGLDIWWHRGKKLDVTEGQYLQMCAYKTGTLARLSARLAAILGGADEETEALLGRLAESLGVGFQIQDDVLSASGKEFQDNKGYGDDITEGKRTLMVIHSLKSAPKEERKELLGILEKHTRDPKLISRALDILRKNGSVEYAREFASRLIEDAWKDAEPRLPDNPAKKTLEKFMRFATTRKI